MSNLILPTPESIVSAIDENVLKEFAREAMNETKSFDHAHGKKLGHAILNNFFINDAPKYNSLAAVEHALGALYKQHGVEFVPQGIKQVVSNYKKKLKIAEGVSLDEVSLSSDEKIAKDKLVIALRKNMKEYKTRYKDKETMQLQMLATALVKKT